MQIKLRKTFYQDNNFHFEFEEMEGWLVLHCNVEHWSLSVYKKMLEVFAVFMNQVNRLGYEGVISYSSNPKFCSLLGGKSMGDLEYEGQIVEVVSWDLK